MIQLLAHSRVVSSSLRRGGVFFLSRWCPTIVFVPSWSPSYLLVIKLFTADDSVLIKLFTADEPSNDW